MYRDRELFKDRFVHVCNLNTYRYIYIYVFCNLNIILNN